MTVLYTLMSCNIKPLIRPQTPPQTNTMQSASAEDIGPSQKLLRKWPNSSSEIVSFFFFLMKSTELSTKFTFSISINSSKNNMEGGLWKDLPLVRYCFGFSVQKFQNSHGFEKQRLLAQSEQRKKTWTTESLHHLSCLYGSNVAPLSEIMIWEQGRFNKMLRCAVTALQDAIRVASQRI